MVYSPSADSTDSDKLSTRPVPRHAINAGGTHCVGTLQKFWVLENIQANWAQQISWRFKPLLYVIQLLHYKIGRPKDRVVMNLLGQQQL